MSKITEIPLKQVPQDMLEAARLLNEGPVLIVYRDGTAVRMETEQGEDPYIWRGSTWVPMLAA